MKTAALSVAVVLAALPWTSRAQEPYPTTPRADPQSYVAAKLGVAVPQHDDLEGFDTGPAFELALGRRMNRNFALEVSVGRFTTSATDTFFDPTVGTIDAEMKFTVIPVAATAKLIAPAGSLEFFGLIGMGVNFVEGSVEASDGFVSATTSDDATSLGLHVGGGLAARLSRQLTLGVDLRYFVAKADLFGFEGGLDSVLVGGTLAFNF